MRADRRPDVFSAVGGDGELGRACDTLISSLLTANGSGRPRRLLVTSAQPAEGKSTIAVCLALRLAATGERALLIDGDLRRPMVHRLLGVAGGSGLMDVLGGEVTPAQAIRTIDVTALTTERGGALDVLASGRVPRNVLAALRSPAVDRVMHDLAASYDMVVIDSPPVLAVSDSLWLVDHVDGVVLVLRTGTTAMRDVADTTERITRAGGRVLGTVLNRFDEAVHGPGFQPYGAYYGVGSMEPATRERRAR